MINSKPKMSTYYNISQLRLESWNDLKFESSNLENISKGSVEGDKQIEKVKKIFKRLESIESYFALPGLFRMGLLLEMIERQEYTAFAHKISEITKLLVSDKYRSNPNAFEDDDLNSDSLEAIDKFDGKGKNYFEVLFVEDISVQEENKLRHDLNEVCTSNDQFNYGIVVQKTFEDAMIALKFNSNIQAVVIRYAPPYKSKKISPFLEPFVQSILNLNIDSKSEMRLGPVLGRLVKKFRPELDTYYVTDTALGNLKDNTLKTFDRIFYRAEDVQELHLTILRGIYKRYETPFFSALKEYSKKPTGIFHAMPISRGNSVFKSRWINDFGKFYGRNMFLAETSSTKGGLDSLLQPTGSLKTAQKMASDAYGSLNTFFVTNGTSTSNKIVVQALVKPGEVILIDRDCHKSHHYGLVLAGAYPVYLDSYPIEKYSMYGAVPLQQIKDKLLQLKEAGRMQLVKMLLLTNCTFDGLVYNVEKVMEEILAIKPDMIFLWDEAWFAFAGFTYNYKQRTGMFVANKLHKKYKSEKYRIEYEEHIKNLKKGEISKLPDPDKVRIRVYSTQSTHKTLSSFRQGSMIHIWDEDFRKKSQNTFLEAYMTHTSTSPNYQILASLDAGRRQVQFEGYELVEKSIELAMVFRAKVNDHPQLKKYFDVLTIGDFIPKEFRASGLSEYYNPKTGWNRMEDAWKNDEFVLDPTKITIHIGRTGVDGDTFKNKYLMDKFNIQINKTSRNTVLLMTNIGTTRSSVTYLTNALLKIADELDKELLALTSAESKIHQDRIESLTQDFPPLPDFSYFHNSFQAVPGVPGGNIRGAFTLAYNEENYEYIPLSECLPTIKEGRVLVASCFIIPYPPGFPVLVPGQVVSEEIIHFLTVLDVSEIHGYRPELGLRIFKDAVLNRQKTVTSMGSNTKK
ncbi:aminotransferase class I/II-fold pyridoxal phosphate-dependent enzyme [Psychroflexus gondwanensis]|jgi:arginine decarboxylase|uniref:aminotransferase class I/II-fold pyridoxal phosphate-dependent enzyme n=1 Tax=Psychroflexus gondwanensis TaxID=251 RepID=UPI0011BE8D34|nr:aminotransferase class I/II-fold pyridoxal phosphate-dependent enzyme [Psychroflexus gondwanensis]TXE18683.1 aminotransferase class I/II-fold pyridoxal phosphate-dependent enzyme [Psychroflexus gondwanensis]